MKAIYVSKTKPSDCVIYGVMAVVEESGAEHVSFSEGKEPFVGMHVEMFSRMDREFSVKMGQGFINKIGGSLSKVVA